MSRSAIWIAYSIVISLLLIAAVYISVLAAPLGDGSIGGAKANVVHYWSSSTVGAFDSPAVYDQHGHGCGADQQTSSPDD